MMTRTLLRRIHLVAGLVGFVIILIFWTSTVSVELFGSHEAIAEVKRAIRWGLILLVPALAITGLSGFRMAGQSTNARVLATKRRMPYIAGIGLVILVPAALYLAAKVDDGLETALLRCSIAGHAEEGLGPRVGQMAGLSSSKAVANRNIGAVSTASS